MSVYNKDHTLVGLWPGTADYFVKNPAIKLLAGVGAQGRISLICGNLKRMISWLLQLCTFPHGLPVELETRKNVYIFEILLGHPGSQASNWSSSEVGLSAWCKWIVLS